MTGKIICIGLGPGDPDLMSVKAHRYLTHARRVAFFRKARGRGVARRLVEGLLPPDAVEIAMEYPITTEIPVTDPRYNAALSGFYEYWTAELLRQSAHEDVVVLCEGDPFFYGSFMHLYARLPRDRVEVVPGIPGMSGCWTATGIPITWGDDILTVLPATLPLDELTRRIHDTDALVVMKIGRNLPRLREALQAADRADQAWLVEYGTMAEERVRMLSEVEGPVPYFSIVLVHGQGRRP